MADNRETTVPKFGSFKPKKSATTPNDPPPNGNTTRSLSNEREVRLCNHQIEKPKRVRTSRVDSYRPRTERKIGQHEQERRDRHRDRPANRDNHTLATQPLDAPYPRQEYEFYFIDTKGDPGNLQYGKPNRWTVSLYHLYGSGSIVGLDPSIKIDRKLSDQNSYTLMYPRNKQPVKVIDLLEIDEPLEQAGAGEDADECEGADEHEAGTAAIDTSQSDEKDFMLLAFRQNQDSGQ